MKVKTREIIKELKEKGVIYSQYNSRIKWTAEKLGIKPKKTSRDNIYTKTEAKQIIDYIAEGYKRKRKTPRYKIEVWDKGLQIELLTSENKRLREENDKLKNRNLIERIFNKGV